MNADGLYMHIPYIQRYVSLHFLCAEIYSVVCDPLFVCMCVSFQLEMVQVLLLRFNISHEVELQTKRWNIPSKYSCNFCNVINLGTERNEMKRIETKQNKNRTTKNEKKAHRPDPISLLLLLDSVQWRMNQNKLSDKRLPKLFRFFVLLFIRRQHSTAQHSFALYHG